MKKETFEIGLVMAGAVSAGSYTAGVVSFLLEALDAWHREKESRNQPVPGHDVVIRVISGTSAGGMTAGILGLALYRDLPVVPNPMSLLCSGNPLFDAWVNMADILPLLQQEDRYEPRLVSLLDSTLLDRIADRIFNDDLPFRKRSYIDAELDLILCMTNLRGIPYKLPFDGNVEHGHQMTLHADHLHFVLNSNYADDDLAAANEHFCLNPFNRSGNAWEMLRQGCLASGAFPLGLASRKIMIDHQKYKNRIQKIPIQVSNRNLNAIQSTLKAKGTDIQASMMHVFEDRAIEPEWPDELKDRFKTEKYAFWASDGGLINNEPFEIARRVLVAKSGLQDQNRDKPNHRIIMIDPFVGRGDHDFEDDTTKRPSFTAVAKAILNALRSQARFKPDELAFTSDSGENTRFLIAPTRWANDVKLTNDCAIASGALSGFSGFLSRDFRVHDYLLGRRNCQQFLKEHFVAEVSPTDFKERFGLEYDDAKSLNWIRWNEKTQREIVPIVPLVGTLRDDPGPPVWPELWPEEYDAIRKQIPSRLNFIFQKLADELPVGKRQVARLLWSAFLRRSTAKTIMNQIRKELSNRDLWKRIR